MHIEQLRQYCISKKGTTEEFPFDNDTLVFKVMGKVFILVPLDRWEQRHDVAVLKLDPEWALQLRESYEGIIGGFQQGRKPDAKYTRTKHWNTVINNQDVPDDLVKELIDHSYDLVVSGFTRKLKSEFDEL